MKLHVLVGKKTPLTRGFFLGDINLYEKGQAMDSRHIFNPRSKTHWVNGVGMAASAGLLVLPGLQGSIGPEAFPWILAGVTATNHVLRSVTTTAVTHK